MVSPISLFSEVETVVSEAAAQAGQSSALVAPTIKFPNLGITIDSLSTGFYIFGIYITWYGVIIAAGIILAAFIIFGLAKRTGQNPDDYIDFLIGAIIFGIIGARLYYVVFSWDYYAANPGEIINIRNGGLAIYGGIIFGFLTILVMCRIKKVSLLRVLDTCVPGVAIAQAIGRWGNFFNREAYGGYTENLFAMQIKESDAAGVISDDLAHHIVTSRGEHYIQVHPTFFYESMLCLVIFILIMIFRKKARYKGEVALWYFGGYGLGRFFIEGLRTDSLMIGEKVAVSQLLALLVFVASLAILVVMRIYISKEPESYAYVNLTVPGWKDLKFEKKKKGDTKEQAEEDTGTEEDAGAEEETGAEEDAGTVEDTRTVETGAEEDAGTVEDARTEGEAD